MINNQPFDDELKKHFGQYTPDVKPHIWENIMASKERKRPAGFWFFFDANRGKFLVLLFILAVTSGVGIYLFNSENGISDRDSGNSNQLAKQRADVSMPGPAAEPGNKNLSNKTDHKSSITGNQETNGFQNNSIDKTGLKSTSPVFKKSTGNLNQSTPSGTGRESAQSSITSSIAASSIVIEKRNTGNKDNDTEYPAISEHDNEQELEPRILKLNLIEPVQKNMAIKEIPIVNLNIPCPKSERNAAGNKRYFEIYAGPDYAFTTFDDTANSTYLQKRKESTSFSSAFSFGFRFTRVFSNGISLRAGLNYSQVNEKFQFSQGNIMQTVHITNSDGDTTGSYATTATRYKTTFNRYRTIDLPLLVGYELGNGKWHANINAGPVVNIYSWQKGDVLDASLQPVNITTGKSSSPYQFKTNMGLGAMAGISIYYRLNQGLHLLAEPYFRYNFSSASKADITLKQKYSTAGLRIGIRKDL